LALLLALALEAGFAAPAWISFVKQAIVRFITLRVISLFYILSCFVIIHPAEASFAGGHSSRLMSARSLLFRVSLFSLGVGLPAFLSAATGKQLASGVTRHLYDFTDLILALGTAISWRAVYDANIIWIACHNLSVNWIVEIGDEFEREFDDLHEDVRTEILALTRLL
jgi:hypothetical protein